MKRLPVLTERMLAKAKATQAQTAMAFEEELRQGNTHTSCRKGCSNCCHHPFLITISEGLLLYRWLVSNGKWNRQLKQRVEEVKDKTTGLAFEVWLMGNIACPLLQPETNECTAYEARPLHCRVTFSTGDPDLCHPHSLGVGTAIVSNVDTIVKFTKEIRAGMRRIGVFGPMMPLAAALTMAEAVDTGKVSLEEADRQYLREMHGGA